MKNISHDFKFLQRHDPRLCRLIALAQGYPKDDPHACLIRLRQYGELLARLWAGKLHLFPEEGELYSDFLDRLYSDREITFEIYEGFSYLRVRGNSALHELQGDVETVAEALVVAKKLANLFKSTFIKVSDDIRIAPKNFPVITESPRFDQNYQKAEAQIKSGSPEGEDCTGRDLCGEDFSGKDLRNYDFTGAVLIKAKFCNSNLSRVSFRGADLRGASFKDGRNLHSNQLTGSLQDSETILPEALQRILDSQK